MVNKKLLLSKMALVGFNNRRLAYELGITETTLGKKMNGKVAMNLVEALKICELCNIDDPKEKADIFLSQSSQ